MQDQEVSIPDDFNFINELGRKSVHLSVLAIPLAYHWIKIELWLIQLTLLVIVVFFIPLEIYRLKINPSTWINYITRQSEKKEPANYILTTTVWLIVLLGVNFLYSIEIAEMAIIATHLGDSIAALIGRGIGRKRLLFTKQKTVEGYLSGIFGTYFVGFTFLLILGVPSFFLPILPTIVIAIFDFFEDLPFWAADNLFHPILTLLLAITLDLLQILS
ncbi:MAG: diacylglycerol/polyprenol kinase family protein [Candidatus Hodarchaeota archaeon]